MSHEWLAWRARVRRRCDTACAGAIASVLRRGGSRESDSYSRTAAADRRRCSCALCLAGLVLAVLLLPRYVLLGAADLTAGFTRPLWGTSDIPLYPDVLPPRRRPSSISSSSSAFPGPSSWSFRDDRLTCERVGWTTTAKTTTTTTTEFKAPSVVTATSTPPVSTKTPSSRRKKRVFDTFIFSSELDLLELRLRELNGTVDAFILVESEFTHTNLRKPLWWRDVGARDPRFAPWRDQIESVVVLRGTSSARAHFRRAGVWGMEALQRQSIMRGLLLRGLQAGDVIITGDIDEIPRRNVVRLLGACEGYPEDMALHMPTSIGGFQFASYEEAKRHTKVRTFRPGRMRARWFSHHATVGRTLLWDAGWHCSWCFGSLDAFRFKMVAGVHADRVRWGGVWEGWWTHEKGDGMMLYKVVGGGGGGVGGVGGTEDVDEVKSTMALLPSDKLLHSRLCRGVPPLERTMAMPESYSLSDAVSRFFAKRNVQGRRERFPHWREEGARGSQGEETYPLAERDATDRGARQAYRILPRAIESSPNQFPYLMPGGCKRPLHIEDPAGIAMKRWLARHVVRIAE